MGQIGSAVLPWWWDIYTPLHTPLQRLQLYIYIHRYAGAPVVMFILKSTGFVHKFVHFPKIYLSIIYIFACIKGSVYFIDAYGALISNRVRVYREVSLCISMRGTKIWELSASRDIYLKINKKNKGTETIL